MKLSDFRRTCAGKPITRFGRATLRRRSRALVELVGGGPEERREAQEWISLFLHDAVLAPGPGPREPRGGSGAC